MSVEDIREEFPIKTIPPIISEPTYNTINKVWQALYENSAAIPTTLRGGRNIHIGLIMDAAVYANVSTTAYARPAEPGPYTEHIPGDSVAARADVNAIHKECRRIYDLDRNVDAALEQEIFADVEETYLYSKSIGKWGVHGVSSKNPMDHLMERNAKYGLQT